MEHKGTFLLLLVLVCLYTRAHSSRLTTFLKDDNLTDVEERLAYLEQTIERRLNVTGRVLGQLLAGRGDANLNAVNVLALRSGLLGSKFLPMMFSAYKSSSEGGISSGVRIRFDQTYINHGSHYHTEDGIFIAPETGVYMFHWTIATGVSAYSTQIIVGGTSRASNLVPRPGGDSSSSALVILNIQKEDHVWIQIYGSDKHVYGGGTSYSNYQSTFSGILLLKT